MDNVAQGVGQGTFSSTFVKASMGIMMGRIPPPCFTTRAGGLGRPPTMQEKVIWEPAVQEGVHQLRECPSFVPAHLAQERWAVSASTHPAEGWSMPTKTSRPVVLEKSGTAAETPPTLGPGWWARQGVSALNLLFVRAEDARGPGGDACPVCHHVVGLDWPSRSKVEAGRLGAAAVPALTCSW